MKHNKLLSLSLLSVLFAASCGGTTPNDPTDDPNSNENPAEVEVFSDKIVQENVDKMLDGFTMEGTITQRRYSYNAATDVDENGHYSIPEDREPIEQNIYHTNVAFNGKTENAFSKYSYREIPGKDGQTITLTSEDYTYFEDEETGYAYQEVIDYKNNVEKIFGSSISNTSNGLTFGDNGFYNIASLFKEGDLVLDENFAAYTRYDLNIDKAAIISNNLLYSLNTGAYALPTEAYIRADNGVFTSLNIELSPIYSYDSYTNVDSLITNSIVFNLGNLGQETITHITPYEETDDSRRLDASLAKFENQNYKMNITIENTELDPNTGGRNETTEARDFYFTGREIYVHDVVDGETTSLDKSLDYYLAPYSETNSLLYPYGYNAKTGEFEIKPNGYVINGNNYRFASGYCGVYVYQDLLPIISDVSGVFFEFDEETQTFVSKSDYVSSLNDCFLVTRAPFNDHAFDSILEYAITLDENDNISSISCEYAYTNELDAIQNDGTITITYSNVGTTTLEGLIA